MSNHKNTPLIKKIQEQYNLHKKLGIKMNICEVARKLTQELKVLVTRHAVNYHLRVNIKK